VRPHRSSKPASPFLATRVETLDLLTVEQVAELLQCKTSSIYNLTRARAAARYAHPLPVIRTPLGLRFLKSDIMAWLMKHREGAA
jgi:predicted DNA-binding transcriptional regulator AlpA